MSTKDFTESVLEKIEEKKLRPRPKWAFIFRHYFILGLTGITVILGSLSTAVIIFLIENNDWDLYTEITDSFSLFIILTLPYAWLIFFFFLILLAYYNFKHTKHGYRYQFHFVIIGALLLSIIGGVIFYHGGLGAKINSLCDNHIPYYHQIMLHHSRVWHQPEKGLLLGVVRQVYSDEEFDFIDLKNHAWRVYYINYTSRPYFPILPDMPLKVLGSPIGQSAFKADLIRPFHFMPGNLPPPMSLRMQFLRSDSR